MGEGTYSGAHRDWWVQPTGLDICGGCSGSSAAGQCSSGCLHLHLPTLLLSPEDQAGEETCVHVHNETDSVQLYTCM